MIRPLCGLGLLITVGLFDAVGSTTRVYAANADHTSDRLLKEVFPGADSFSEKGGAVPVYKAYKSDPESGGQVLLGYAVVTADVLPEPSGYSGPIDTLIGIDLEGKIVGLRPIYYKESHRYTLGDFLSFRSWTNQFIGKRAEDGFSVGRRKDLDGIAKATISSKAMARGVRQALRAVTETYLSE
jgi:transcriptional regulator of nitric oxide reductase